MNTRDRRLGGFTLIELLVVIGIIGVLISILLPSMSAARNSANNVRIKGQLNAVKQALEAFKNDVGDYPDSAKRFDPTDYASSGDDPLNRIVNHPGNGTVIYGAQSLARALVGKGLRGYVSTKRAREYDRSLAPTEWYDDRFTDYTSPFPHEVKYFNETHAIIRTATDGTGNRLLGVRPNSISGDNDQWIMVDSFDQPILYYRANPRGNILADATATDTGANGFAVYQGGSGDYDCLNQPVIPTYNLLDNDVFTGSQSCELGIPTSDEPGWQFGTRDHQIRELGNPCNPDNVSDGCLQLPDPQPDITMPFARYIHDHKSEDAAAGVVRAVNPDTYLLISAGRDGIYGTADDINNFQER